MNKVSAALLAGLLTATINTASASYYFKGYIGNSLINTDYKQTINSMTPSLSDKQEFGELASDNAITPGLTFGYNGKIDKAYKLGVELDIKKQFNKQEFRMTENQSASLLTNVGLMEVNVENNYKINLSAVLTVFNSFYFKLGPSYIDQDVDLKITESTTNATFKKNESKSILGVNMGTGFIYRVNNNFGLFTEYNFSYYPDEDLGKFDLTNAQISNITASHSEQFRKRKIGLSQNELFFGFIYSNSLT